MKRDLTKSTRWERDQRLRAAAAHALGCLMAHYFEPQASAPQPAQSPVQPPAATITEAPSLFKGELHHVG